jgi:hypothetical protein
VLKKWQLNFIGYAYEAENYEPKLRDVMYPYLKYFIFDIDETLNRKGTPDLITSTFLSIAKYNKKFKESLPEIKELIVKARDEADRGSLDVAIERIIECKLKRSIMERACLEAVQNFCLIPHLHEALIILRNELKYNLHFASGSFRTAVKLLTKRFEPLNIGYSASTLYFEDGILKGIDLMIGKRKAQAVRNLLGDTNLCIVATDDLEFDKELGELGIEKGFPVLVVGEKLPTYFLVHQSPLIIERKMLREDALEYVGEAGRLEAILFYFDKGLEYIEGEGKKIREIVTSKNKERIKVLAREIYLKRRKDFTVEDMLDFILENDINKLQEFVHKRFLESRFDDLFALMGNGP